MVSPYKKSFAAEQLRKKKEKSFGFWVLLIALAVILVIGGYALYYRFGTREKSTQETEQIKSIAVLPFRNMSPEKDQDYFCDGIAEEIITTLSKINGLRVIASTSSFEFKGKENIISEIGRKLDVQTVLEGSVRKEENQLRITAQLINVSDESHLWSAQYDREIKSVFAIQSDISRSIVEALKGRLLGEEKTAIEKRPTDDAEAYELYLLGRHSMDIGDNVKAVNYFQQAIDRDPDFALAYVGLANAYPLSWFLAEQAAAEKALELDNNLAEAHTIMAYISFFQLWDIPAAERGYKRAIELNPGSAEAHFYYGYFLMAMGQFEEALRENEQARELNPLFIPAYSRAMHLCSLLGRYEQAMEYYHKGIKINPDSRKSLRNMLGRYHAMQGNYDEAIKIFTEIGHKAFLGHCYAMNGEREKAKKILNDLTESNAEPILSAFIHAGLGDYDKTFECFEKSLKSRVIPVIFIKSDFQFDPIRSDPRYKPLIKRIFYESKRKPPLERKAVSIDPGIYDEYAGIYVRDSAGTLTVIKENGRLFGQLTNTPIFEMFPESGTMFFSKMFEYPFLFVRNDIGRITDVKILSPESGKTFYIYKKIK